MSTVDCVVTSTTTMKVSTDEAKRIVRELSTVTNILVLSTDGESLVIFDDLAPWTYHRAQGVALMRGYHQFAYTNIDGTRGGGYLTGRGSYTPISRREPARLMTVA